MNILNNISVWGDAMPRSVVALASEVHEAPKAIFIE
jgi:hypothetical protein